MSDSRVRVWVAGAGVMLAVALYATRLDVSPVYFTHDEAIYGANAYSVATTGRDLNGQFLPLAIPVVGSFYATPANIYTTALFLTLLPVSEVTIRLPSVLVGLVCVWLVYRIGRRMFDREVPALAAAALLVVTPAHFIHSRLATDHLYLVACILAWLLVLLRWYKTRSDWTLGVAMAWLGASIYTYLGAMIAAPVYAAITLGWMASLGVRSLRTYAAAIAGFVLLVLPFAIWHLAHPAQFGQQMQMYGLRAPVAAAVTESAPASAPSLTSAPGVIERVSVYWDYFSPSFLFLSGDTGLINGTRFTGVFLLPMIVLLPLGVYATLVAPDRQRKVLILLVLFAAPIAATVVGERYRINRSLIMLPAAAVLAAAGIDWLWSSRRAAARLVTVGIIVALTVQFAAFYRDYFDGYRVRSYPWFEYNIRGGMEEIIRLQPTPPQPVFIARSIQWAEYYWPLYVLKHQRAELRDSVSYIHAADAANTVPIGGWMLCRVGEESTLIASGFQRVAAIPEPDGTHWLSVLRR